MMPMILPAWARSRPPYLPGWESISRTALAPITHANGDRTSVIPPQSATPTSPTMPRTIDVVADGWSGSIPPAYAGCVGDAVRALAGRRTRSEPGMGWAGACTAARRTGSVVGRRAGCRAGRTGSAAAAPRRDRSVGRTTCSAARATGTAGGGADGAPVIGCVSSVTSGDGPSAGSGCSASSPEPLAGSVGRHRSSSLMASSSQKPALRSSQPATSASTVALTPSGAQEARTDIAARSASVVVGELVRGAHGGVLRGQPRPEQQRVVGAERHRRAGGEQRRAAARR